MMKAEYILKPTVASSTTSETPRPVSKDDIASFIGPVKTLNNWSRALSQKMDKI